MITWLIIKSVIGVRAKVKIPSAVAGGVFFLRFPAVFAKAPVFALACSGYVWYNPINNTVQVR